MSARWFQVYGQESAVEAIDPSKTFIDLGEFEPPKRINGGGHGHGVHPITPDEELRAQMEAARAAAAITGLDPALVEAGQDEYNRLQRELAAELAAQPTPWEPNLPLVIGGTALATLLLSRWLFRP